MLMIALQLFQASGENMAVHINILKTQGIVEVMYSSESVTTTDLSEQRRLVTETLSCVKNNRCFCL